MVAHQVALDGFLDQHVKLIRKVYRERRDVMLAAMDRSFPPQVDWTQPQGGLFLWGTLPVELDAAAVLQAAVAKKVAFVPGAPFFPTGGGLNTMRLNFSNASPENIREGINRLGEVLGEQIARLKQTIPVA
jgi:2-aminoadipate transaminase